MSQQINIEHVVALIKIASGEFLDNMARAAIFSATMDLRANNARAEADNALKSLVQLTGVLQSGVQPAPKVQIAG